MRQKYTEKQARERAITRYADFYQLNIEEKLRFRRICKYLDIFLYRGHLVSLRGAV